jgi:GTP-binding protein EngB required for normal cell division
MSNATDRLLATRRGTADALVACPGASIQQIDRICREFRIDSLLPQVNAYAEVMEDGGIVDVAVVGRFKAGKSSFLNSIIGQDVIPVAVLPLTAAVTRLRYGPIDRVIVRHLDDTEHEIPLADLAEYVTEDRNPSNIKGVALVDVELMGLRPYRGIRFVDTPGLGSVFAHNTRTSMEWLPRVGAALLAVSIDQPLSEYDIELLKELGRHTPEVTILLTKADLVRPDELEQVMRFITQQVVTVAGGGVIPFSIRPGFEALRRATQDYLLRHIAQHHEEKAQEIGRHKLRSLVAVCREYLRMALSAAGAAQDAREQLQRQLQQERHDLSTVRNEMQLLSINLKDRLRDDTLKQFLGHYSDVTSGLTGDLRQKMAHWRGNLWKTTETFEHWAQETLHAQLGPLSSEQGDTLAKQHLAEVHASFHRVVRAFQDRLAKGIEQALHITFSGAEFEAVVKQPKRPDISIGRVFDTPIETLWFIIPMFIFRPLVNRHFVHLLPWEIEKNLHRLAAQWSTTIAKSVDDLADQAQRFIQEEMTTIEGLVAKAQDQRPAIERALATLDGLAGEIGEEA